MGIPRRILLISLCLALVAGLAWLFTRPHEPVYQGRTMSAWIKLRVQADQSLLDNAYGRRRLSNAEHEKIGKDWRDFNTLLLEDSTNILPYLIKALKTPDNRLWKFYSALCTNLPGPMAQWLPYWPEPFLVRFDAVEMIGRMYLRAGPAVPALCDALLHDPNPRVRSMVLETLPDLGPAAASAVPTLLQLLTNDPDPLMRWMAIGDLINIHPEAGRVVPTLIGALQDSQPDVRAWSARALRNYGPDAAAAIQPLRTLASGTNQNAEDVSAARAALEKIDPTGSK